MSLAWETTREDVHTVLTQRLGLDVDLERQEVETAFDLVAEEVDRIEDAALRGDDMDEQTDLAHDEIEAILRENDYI